MASSNKRQPPTKPMDTEATGSIPPLPPQEPGLCLFIKGRTKRERLWCNKPQAWRQDGTRSPYCSECSSVCYNGFVEGKAPKR